MITIATTTKINDAAKREASGKKQEKKGAIGPPWRESVLTWLLREPMTGNSKTTMISAISPAQVR